MNISQIWLRNYNLCKKYYETHGNLFMPVDYTVDNHNIYKWLQKQKYFYNSGQLDLKKIELLEDIKIVWCSRPSILSFEQIYSVLNSYYQKYGNFDNIDENCIYENYWLPQLIRQIHKRYNNNLLTSKQISTLKKINFPFSSLWQQYYLIAKEYYVEHGHLIVKNNEIYKGVPLGKWISYQRSHLLTKSISKKHIKMLGDIGMIWDYYEYKWMIYYNLCKKYYDVHGNLQIPQDYMDGNYNLYSWLKNQIRFYRKNKLSQQRTKLLEEIGVCWNYEKWRWNEQYKLCNEYFKKYGNLDLPTDYKVGSYNLEKWLKKQAEKKDNNNLSLEHIQLLDELKIDWQRYKNTNIDTWENNYLLAKKYYEKNGNLLIPRSYKVGDINLGKWIANQRTKKDQLSDEQRSKLDAIGMVWKVLEKERLTWNEAYAIARDYFLENGNIFIKQGERYHDFSLGSWIAKQKKMYKEGKLFPEQIAKLNVIQIPWTLEDKRRIIAQKEAFLKELDLKRKQLQRQLLQILNEYQFNNIEDVKVLVNKVRC